MSELKQEEKDKVQQFVSFTQSNEYAAIECLTNVYWNLEMACDLFFANSAAYMDQTPTAQQQGGDNQKIDKFFAKYANDPKDKEQKVESDRIGPNGMVRLLHDLDIAPTSRSAMVLAWKMKAEKPCEFTQKEFRDGLTALKPIGTLDAKSFRSALIKAEQETLADPQKFSDLYQFVFNYVNLGNESSLELETAVACWEVLLEDIGDVRGGIWVDFLRARKVKDISWETWNLLLKFLNEIDFDMGNYDVDGDYPEIFDQFVEWCQDSSLQSK
uniref:Defective in cullin neddylation protein n=1 Tax=Globodera rostochiensis TaxID=31243 RepID=A0A914HTP8_GLORO